jgi:hypothetical protein
MTYKTIQGLLHPDGTLSLSDHPLPDHSVPVMVTILEPTSEESLSDLGDYQSTLVDYEDRLAQGEVKWQ